MTTSFNNLLETRTFYRIRRKYNHHTRLLDGIFLQRMGMYEDFKLKVQNIRNGVTYAALFKETRLR